jgi:Phage integrase, N-terminal SAM-like domain
MTPLRQRMIEDMQVRNLAPHTQRAYLQYISQFARHFHRSPDLLGSAVGIFRVQNSVYRDCSVAGGDASLIATARRDGSAAVGTDAGNGR